MSSDLDLLLARLNLMQEAVLTDSNAVPVAFYMQAWYPFWTNRVDMGDVEWDSQDFYSVRYTVVMRLVLASFTEDIQTEAEKRIAANVPVILDYFARRRQLKRTSADAALTNLDPMGGEITSVRSLYGVLDSGIGVNQFGVEFTLEVSFKYQVDQSVF